MKREPLAEKLGKDFADTIMSSAHITYNAPRGIKIVQSCIKRLQERIVEIKPKKATPEYLLARYRKKKKKKTGKIRKRKVRKA